MTVGIPWTPEDGAAIRKRRKAIPKLSIAKAAALTPSKISPQTWQKVETPPEHYGPDDNTLAEIMYALSRAEAEHHLTAEERQPSAAADEAEVQGLRDEVGQMRAEIGALTTQVEALSAAIRRQTQEGQPRRRGTR